MSRLKQAAGRLGATPSRLGHAPGDRAGYDRQREQTSAWRKWYRTERWKQVRLTILQRDGWRCRKTGEPLTGRGQDPNAPVIHHITPHNGDERMFWDERNLIAVSKAWHDSEGQREDKAAGHW